MKTNHTKTRIITPDFPGIVIDPETQRLCALQVDIFKGLGLAGCQVTACNPRVYQERYYDVLDVVEARAKIRKKPVRGIIALERIGNLETLNTDNQ